MNNPRYADDTALIAYSDEKLQVLANSLIEESTNNGMKVNITKTQVLVISRRSSQVPTNIEYFDIRDSFFLFTNHL